jgi:hypothetical protein
MRRWRRAVIAVLGAGILAGAPTAASVHRHSPGRAENGAQADGSGPAGMVLSMREIVHIQ